ncbi:MAG TPA: YHS domain-containing protein [Anaerolineae bacterium]|nr:YHS domain-containing protein [Anaerolineae bacterium]
MVKDPVCGMEIDPKDAYATREHAGKTFYFCSKSCVDQFDADPHKYGHPQHDNHGHEENAQS